MEHFGAYLKAQREKKGVRLEEIASITKIHIHSLELLELSHWEHLPPEPFIRGFIIAYAKYVGLDPKETIGKYLEEVSPGVMPKSSPDTPALETEVTEPHRSTPGIPETPAHKPSATEVIEHAKPISSRKVAMVAAGIFVFVVTVSIIYIGKRASESQVAETSDSTAAKVSTPQAADAKGPSPTGAEPSPNAAQPSEPRGVASPQSEKPSATTSSTSGDYKHQVVIEGRERTWIKVVVDEEPPIEYFLPQGEKAKYDAKDKIKVVLGNATGSKVTHNGEAAVGKQYQGTIRSYIFPQGSRFPQDMPSKRMPATKDADSDDTTTIQ
jgi:cytoskeleton protein RodZ